MDNKIFVIGFPKAGTTSIHDALECAGYKSVHWGIYESNDYPVHAIRFGKNVSSVGMLIKLAKYNNLPLLYYLNNYNAFTQMDISLDKNLCYWPQLTDIPLLDKQYPNSKFIFNTRPLNKWISSVNRWGDLKLRLTKLEIPGLPYGVGSKDDELVKWHDWHKNNMIEYFKNDEDKFTIFNIEEDNPKKLANFLGLKSINFGHKNENKRNSIYNSSSMSPPLY